MRIAALIALLTFVFSIKVEQYSESAPSEAFLVFTKGNSPDSEKLLTSIQQMESSTVVYEVNCDNNFKLCIEYEIKQTPRLVFSTPTEIFVADLRLEELSLMNFFDDYKANSTVYPREDEFLLLKISSRMYSDFTLILAKVMNKIIAKTGLDVEISESTAFMLLLVYLFALVSLLSKTISHFFGDNEKKNN